MVTYSRCRLMRGEDKQNLPDPRVILPRGPSETSLCLAAKIVSPLSRGNFWLEIALAENNNPSQTVSRPQERAFFFLQNDPRGEGNYETIERQNLSRGNFCLATSGCLFWPTGLVTADLRGWLHLQKRSCFFLLLGPVAKTSGKKIPRKILQSVKLP